MFSSKDFKTKLVVYMGLGGMIAIIGVLFGIGMPSSVTAQRDKFEEIECTKLTIVDSEGNQRVLLTNEGFMKIENENGTVSSIRGGDLRTYYLTIEQNGMPIARLGRDEKKFVAGKLTINNTLGQELVRIGPSEISYFAGQITIHENGSPMHKGKRFAKTLDLDAGNVANQITITNKITPDEPSLSLAVTPLGSSVKAD